MDPAWKEDGRFAILRDMTNCLRIGDATVFGDDGPETIEVKPDALRRGPAQRQRIAAAQRAVRELGPLPGDDPKRRLYDLDLPFRTHLDLQKLGAKRAAQDGFRAKVQRDRDQYGQRVTRSAASAARGLPCIRSHSPG